MSLSNFSADMNVISNLPDAPNLAASELKRKFDTAGIAIKNYINDDMVPFINNMAESGIADNSILARHFKTTDIPAGEESVANFINNHASNTATNVVNQIYWSTTNAVDSHFATNVINGGLMLDLSINATQKITNYSINDMKLMTNAVHGDIIKNGSITDIKLDDCAVISNKIDNAAILNQHIGTGAINPNRLNHDNYFGILRQRYTSATNPAWDAGNSVYKSVPTVANNAACTNGVIIFVLK